MADGPRSAVVIGAGMSGAFAADTLRRRLGPRLRLDVLERDTRTGGRASYRRVCGAGVETGASRFHSSNHLLASAAEDLEVVPADSAGALGIWDGTRLLLRTRGDRTDPAPLLARYRRPLLRAGRQVTELVRDLDRVYQRLRDGEAWASSELLWRDLGLDGLIRVAAADHFPPGRLRTEFAREGGHRCP